jgi:hypothetical protein
MLNKNSKKYLVIFIIILILLLIISIFKKESRERFYNKSQCQNWYRNRAAGEGDTCVCEYIDNLGKEMSIMIKDLGNKTITKEEKGNISGMIKDYQNEINSVSEDKICCKTLNRAREQAYETHPYGPSLNYGNHLQRGIRCVGTSSPWGLINKRRVRAPKGADLLRSDPCLAYIALNFLKTWTPFINTVLENQDYLYPRGSMTRYISRNRFDRRFLKNYNLKKILAEIQISRIMTFFNSNPRLRWTVAGGFCKRRKAGDKTPHVFPECRRRGDNDPRSATVLGEKLGETLLMCKFPTNRLLKQALKDYYNCMARIFIVDNNNISETISQIVNEPERTVAAPYRGRAYPYNPPHMWEILNNKNEKTIINGMMRTYFKIMRTIEQTFRSCGNLSDREGWCPSCNISRFYCNDGRGGDGCKNVPDIQEVSFDGCGKELTNICWYDVKTLYDKLVNERDIIPYY